MSATTHPSYTHPPTNTANRCRNRQTQYGINHKGQLVKVLERSALTALVYNFVTEDISVLALSSIIMEPTK